MSQTTMQNRFENDTTVKGAEIPFAGEVLANQRRHIKPPVSQSELAKRLGGKWDKSRVCRYETGRTKFTWSMVEKFCEALEIKPELVLLECFKMKYPSLKDVSNELEAIRQHLLKE